nr:MAG TPA: hypothetical protein [Bacteriophage sp.]
MSIMFFLWTIWNTYYLLRSKSSINIFYNRITILRIYYYFI